MIKSRIFISNSKLVNLFFFIFLFTIQFYTNPGGQFQYSYFFFILFSFLVLRHLLIRDTIKLSIVNYFIIIILFAFYAFFLNLYYFFLYLNFEFVKASILFFVGIFVAFTVCSFLYYFNVKEFFKISIIISNLSIFFFYIFNLGEYR